MSTSTVQLPESLKKRIEALAAKEGYTISQFLASAAGEKLAVVLTMDYLRREAGAEWCLVGLNPRIGRCREWLNLTANTLKQGRGAF